jgi:RNA polymerase sigma factor (sigma-70 family)
MTERRVAENAGYVVREAARYAESFGVDQDDLIQEGFVGLLEADRRFVDMGAKFLTYAAYHVAVRVRRYAIEMSGPICRTEYQLEKYNLRFPTVSLDEPLTPGGGTYSEVFGEDETVTEAADRGLNRKLIFAAMQSLKKRERMVVTMRYFEGHSPVEIGRRMGVSRQYVLQLEKKALVQLRRIMSRYQ